MALEPTLRYESNFSARSDFELGGRTGAGVHLRAGDIFQVVIGQRLFTTTATPPFEEIYRSLRVVNPSPFIFYLRLPSGTLVGNPPEILVRVQAGP